MRGKNTDNGEIHRDFPIFFINNNVRVVFFANFATESID